MAPLRRQRVGGAFGIFTGKSARIAQVCVGQLVGNYPSDKLGWAMAQRSLEHNRPTRRPCPWNTYADHKRATGHRFIITHVERGVVGQV